MRAPDFMGRTPRSSMSRGSAGFPAAQWSARNPMPRVRMLSMTASSTAGGRNGYGSGALLDEAARGVAEDVGDSRAGQYEKVGVGEFRGGDEAARLREEDAPSGRGEGFADAGFLCDAVVDVIAAVVDHLGLALGLRRGERGRWRDCRGKAGGEGGAPGNGFFIRHGMSSGRRMRRVHPSRKFETRPFRAIMRSSISMEKKRRRGWCRRLERFHFSGCRALKVYTLLYQWTAQGRGCTPR